MYSCHLLISSASVKSIPFLFFVCAYQCMKYSLGISNFLKEISSLSHSTVFFCFSALVRLSYLSLIFFGTLHSGEDIFLFLLFLLLLFFSQLFVRPPRQSFCLLLFFFLGMVFITASSTVLCISIHSSSGTLSDLIP